MAVYWEWKCRGPRILCESIRQSCRRLYSYLNSYFMLYVHLSPSKQELCDDYLKLSLIPGPVWIREPKEYHVIFEPVLCRDLLILRNMLASLNDYGFERLNGRVKIDYWKHCLLQRNGINDRSLHHNIQISPHFHMAASFWQQKQQRSFLLERLRKITNLHEH